VANRRSTTKGKFSTLRASMTKDSLGFFDESKRLSCLVAFSNSDRYRAFSITHLSQFFKQSKREHWADGRARLCPSRGLQRSKARTLRQYTRRLNKAKSTSTDIPVSPLSHNRVQRYISALVLLGMIVDLNILESEDSNRAHYPLRTDIPPSVLRLNRFRIWK
jgi:hypothetical protein